MGFGKKLKKITKKIGNECKKIEKKVETIKKDKKIKQVSKKIGKISKYVLPIVAEPYVAPLVTALPLVDKIADEKSKKIIKKGINFLTQNKKK